MQNWQQGLGVGGGAGSRARVRAGVRRLELARRRPGPPSVSGRGRSVPGRTAPWCGHRGALGRRRARACERRGRVRRVVAARGARPDDPHRGGLLDHAHPSRVHRRQSRHGGRGGRGGRHRRPERRGRARRAVRAPRDSGDGRASRLPRSIEPPTGAHAPGRADHPRACCPGAYAGIHHTRAEPCAREARPHRHAGDTQELSFGGCTSLEEGRCRSSAGPHP